MNNNNGFADALNQLNTVLDVGKDVEMEVLENAARFFAEKLRAEMPKGDRAPHLKDQLQIVIKADHVQLTVRENGWYFWLVEKGHKKAGGKGRVKGRHFFKRTLEKYGDKVAEMMAEQIINHMGG